MKKLSFSLAFLGLAVAAYLALLYRFLSTTRWSVDQDEQAVYSIVLGVPTGKILILNDSTQSSFDYLGDTRESARYIRNSMPSLSMDTLNSYMDRNDRSYPLSADMELGMEYHLVSDEELDEIFAQGGWEEFYGRYPDASGNTTVSRVGFNRDLTEALVYVGNQSAPLAGTGYLIRLEKQDGEWRVRDQVMLWIS